MSEKTCSTCQCNKVCDHNNYGFENCGNYISGDLVPRAELEALQRRYDLAVAEREANVKGFSEEIAKAKSKGATEALVILYKELVDYHEKIKNDYMELPQKSTNTARFRGESSTVEHICNMVLKLKKKYTEEGK